MDSVPSAGLRPIATCSPANFGLALRFGAEKVFDYHSASCAADIRAYTNNQLAYALDCITQADTTKLCYASIGRAGGRYVALEPFRDTVAQTRALTIVPSWLMVLTIFGGQVALLGDYYRDANPEDREVGAKLFATVQSLLDRGLIDPHPVKAMPGGWQGVLQGVDMIRTQPPSGQKLVYSVV
jgi:NADPH:quinone reductase-like Zn-dependent oxidoreductase